MSLAMEFHTWINAQSFIPGVINFNVTRPDDIEPWFVMNVGESTQGSFTLCSNGGDQTIEILAYGSERYGTYELLDKLRIDIEKSLRGSLPTYSVWMVKTTGAVSTGTVEEQLNEYSIGIIISWEKER